MTATGEEQLIERVRERYAAAALTVLETGGQASCAMPIAAPPRAMGGGIVGAVLANLMFTSR